MFQALFAEVGSDLEFGDTPNILGPSLYSLLPTPRLYLQWEQAFALPQRIHAIQFGRFNTAGDSQKKRYTSTPSWLSHGSAVALRHSGSSGNYNFTLVGLHYLRHLWALFCSNFHMHACMVCTGLVWTTPFSLVPPSAGPTGFKVALAGRDLLWSVPDQTGAGVCSAFLFTNQEAPQEDSHHGGLRPDFHALLWGITPFYPSFVCGSLLLAA